MSSHGPALVQNRKSQAHFLFGKGAGAEGQATAEESETFEMKQLKRRHTRDASDTPPPSIEREGEATYVIHVVEPHHTLRGISLQYRVPVREKRREERGGEGRLGKRGRFDVILTSTNPPFSTSQVEEIKRLNMMWTDDELHTRKVALVVFAAFPLASCTPSHHHQPSSPSPAFACPLPQNLKIPVDPNGIIYYAVMNNKLDELLDEQAESNSPHTHTTKNLLKPTDVLPREPNDRYQMYEAF